MSTLDDLEAVAKQAGLEIFYHAPDGTYSQWGVSFIHTISGEEYPSSHAGQQPGWADTKRAALEAALRYWRFL